MGSSDAQRDIASYLRSKWEKGGIVGTVYSESPLVKIESSIPLNKFVFLHSNKPRGLLDETRRLDVQYLVLLDGEYSLLSRFQSLVSVSTGLPLHIELDPLSNREPTLGSAFGGLITKLFRQYPEIFRRPFTMLLSSNEGGARKNIANRRNLDRVRER